MTIPYLASATTFLKRFRYGEHPAPQRDWIIVLSVSFVLLIASAAWSYFVFLRVSADDLVGETAKTAPTVNANSLTVVKQVFTARAEERTRYLSEYHFVDPSR